MSAANLNTMMVKNMVFNPTTDDRVKGNQPNIGLEINFTNAKTLKPKSGGADKALADVQKAESIPIITVEVGASRAAAASHQSVSGSAQFKNLRFVTSAMDAYTPSFMQAGITGESFTTAKFYFIEYGAGGKAQITMTITLSNGYATHVDIIGGLLYVELSAQSIDIDTVYKTSCKQSFYSK